MKKISQTKQDQAQKKVQIAIDKILDLQCMDVVPLETTGRLLDQLNSLESRVLSVPVKN